MKSQKLGKNTSACEVLNVSPNGVWLLVKDREFLLTYEKFPWFKDAKVGEIYNVELASDRHVRWPDLDVDLELETLESPEKYPLIYKK
jgi:hypothetical protein